MDVTACLKETGDMCTLEVDLDETLQSLKRKFLREFDVTDAEDVDANWYFRVRGGTEDLMVAPGVSLSDVALEAGSVVELGRRLTAGINAPQKYPCHAPILRMTLSCCGKWCAVGLSNNTAEIWDTETGERERILEVGKPTEGKVWGIAFSRCARLVVTGSSDAMIRVWERESSVSEHIVLSGHRRCVNSVLFSSCGRYIVSSSDDGTVRTWSLSTGACTRTIQCSSGWVKCTVSPTSDMVIASDHKSKLRILNFTTGECTRSIPLGTITRALLILQCGMRAATGGVDGVIRLWDLTNGTCIGKLTGHVGEVKCLSASHCGGWLVSGADGSIREWDLQTRQCIRSHESQRPPTRGLSSRRTYPVRSADRMYGVAVSPCAKWIFRTSCGAVKAGSIEVEVMSPSWVEQ